MASEHGQLIPLSQLAHVLGGYAFKGVDLGSTGYRVVKIADIEPPRINVEGCDRIPTEKVQGLDRFKLEDLDVLVAMTGATTGKAGRLRTSAPAYLNQRVAKISALAGKEYDDFIWAIVSQPGFDQLIMQNAHGSAQPNVSAEGIGRILIPQIAPHEQLAIGKFVRLLDDNIELNRRMNATLEAIARALFQSWFVDFDPVRAKAAGQTPAGMDPATAALFPAEFEDSELGEIPKGWAAGCIDDAFDLTMGQSPPGSTYNEAGDGLPFYQGRTDYGFRFPTRRVYCNAPTRFANERDVLVSVRAPVGDVNVANERCCIGRGVAAVRSKTDASSFALHTMLSLRENFQRFDNEGTVFGSINKNDFAGMPLVIPPPKVISAFEDVASSLDARVAANEAQSRTLAALRDALLPKLLSGEKRTIGT